MKRDTAITIVEFMLLVVVGIPLFIAALLFGEWVKSVK